jgi:hypothetical protein
MKKPTATDLRYIAGLILAGLCIGVIGLVLKASGL